MAKKQSAQTDQVAPAAKTDTRKIEANYYLGTREYKHDEPEDVAALAKAASEGELRQLLAHGIISGNWLDFVKSES